MKTPDEKVEAMVALTKAHGLLRGSSYEASSPVPGSHGAGEEGAASNTPTDREQSANT